MRIVLTWAVRVIYSFALLVTIAMNMPRFSEVDPKLQTYVDSVKYYTNGKLGNFTRIGFDKNLTDPVLGNCRSTLFFNDVGINKKLWTTLSFHEKIVLLAHELLHCEKDVDHKPGYDKIGCPIHIMNPSSGGAYCSKANFDRYMDQAMEY